MILPSRATAGAGLCCPGAVDPTSTLHLQTLQVLDAKTKKTAQHLTKYPISHVALLPYTTAVD